MTEPEDPEIEIEEIGEIKPGFASEDPTDDQPVLTGDLKVAHYAGATPDEATKIWERETLCVSCLCSGVCKIAAGTQDPLVVVSRCLAYLPVGG